MKTPIRVNYLVLFRVVKNMPDSDAYLCSIAGTELFARLPRNQTVKKYGVGDTDWASIMEIRGARITLSQRTPAYVRRIIEYLLRDELTSRGLTVKKVTRFRDQIKVMLRGPENITNRDLAGILGPHTASDDFRKYLPGQRITFVMYREKIEDLIRSVLLHEECVDAVYYLEEIGTALVYCTNGSIPLLIGQDGWNVVTAKRLLAELGFNINIEIKS